MRIFLVLFIGGVLTPLGAIFVDSIIHAKNTHLAISGFNVQVDDRLISCLVSERNQGNVDLNGDGDAFDQVYHIIDTETMNRVNLQLDGGKHVLKNNKMSFTVSESGQGADLNGDGDTRDDVLHFYRHHQLQTQNLGIAAIAPFEINQGKTLFRASERDQGQDMNGDGDTNDYVVHNYNILPDTIDNLSLASSGHLHHNRNFATFLVRERDQGNQDLNGDGDMRDDIIYGYDFQQATAFNSRLVSGGIFKLKGRKAVADVSEDSTQDYNNDGDMFDQVLQVIDLKTGAVLNTGFATSFHDYQKDHVLCVISEGAQGQTDFNGDGDTTDQVYALYNTTLQTMTNIGLAAHFSPKGRIIDRQIVLSVSEFSQGNSDLNGDGDANDTILHIYNIITGSITNLNLHISDSVAFEGDRLVFTVGEAGQGFDLNGDGDTADFVLFEYDLSTGIVFNRGVAASDFDIQQGVITFRRPEGGNFDFNGDGDMNDRVAFLYSDLGLINLKVSSFNIERDQTLLEIEVSESSQNKDLNFDGDMNDTVLHFTDYSIFGK